MAQQSSLFKYRGRLDKTVGVLRDGKYHFRSLPLNVRQSNRTRMAAKRFGEASNIGALIRRAFTPSLYEGFDKRYINQLTKTIYTGVDIKGFRFNQEMGIGRFFQSMPFVSRDGILHLPAHHSLSITVIAARINFETKEVVGRVVIEDLAQPIDVPGEGTLVVTMQVSDGKRTAADIIAVLEPVVFKEQPVFTGYREARVLKLPRFIPFVIQRE